MLMALSLLLFTSRGYETKLSFEKNRRCFNLHVRQQREGWQLNK